MVETSAQRAIQFATLEQNEIQITHEAMEFLGSLPCDQKLSIVTVVGPVSAGKSSLANRLIDNQQSDNSFPLRDIADAQKTPAQPSQSAADPSKTSRTSGIMMWNQLLPLKKTNSHLLILDMQGLPPPTPAAQSSTALMRSPRTSALRSPRGALNRSNPTDRLLAFATLISSLVVYTHKRGGASLQDALAECLDPLAKFSDLIQKELGAELGHTASVLSTNSAGNISARSFGTSASVLDITTTVASDLKDIVCQSMMIVMNEFEPTEAQVAEGVMQHKAAKLALEQAFTACSGVTSETIRKNKALECIKSIFPHRSVLSVAPSTTGETHNKDLARLVGTIKKKVSHKAVYGKALNGNMLLALSLEYAETLSQPQSSLTLPGMKSSMYGSLMMLFQAFNRVSEEEVMRISDTVLSEFVQEVGEQVNEQTMPLADKTLNKTVKHMQEKYRARLRQDLAEIATFDEVMLETEKMEERMRQHCELKRQENYSQGYFFTVGLLKQLYANVFTQDSGNLSASEIKEKWLLLSNDFKVNSGVGDFTAKYDVFAECLNRLPSDTKTRFVDYSKVDCEQATDLADETDAADRMDQDEGQVKPAVPNELLKDQIQIMSLLEQQIEQMKSEYEHQLTACQVEAQKTYQNQQQLEQAKQDNELKMAQLRAECDQVTQQKNDMELKVQAADHEREQLQSELDTLVQMTDAEQQKHKAKLEQQSSVGEEELQAHRTQADELRTQLSQLDEQLMREEQESRSEVQQLEVEIQTSRDEQDQMEQALAQKDNTALLQQVNQFFGQEVPEQYLAKIKEVFGSNTQEAKELKLKLFEEQRKLNDVDYQYTQDQLRLKQRLDEQFKTCRQKKDRELKDVQQRHDQARHRHLELSQKKESTNHQLQQAMRQLEESQDQVISFNEVKEQTQKKIDEDVSKIVELKASLSEAGMGVETLEHKIYEMSVQNKNQMAVKERLIELVSEQVKASARGKPTPEMLAILQSMLDERLRSRLEQILLPKGN